MSEEFKIVQEDNPQVSYQTKKDAFSLGRSQDCEIVIEDPHISRVQAKVRAHNSKYIIKNIGRNPLLINGKPSSERYLRDGDILTLGKIKFIFQTSKPAEQIAPEVVVEEKTVVVTGPVEEAAGCRLMIAAADGETRAVPFDQEKLVLGRSVEADVQLNDPLISRRHCVIERLADGVYARNVSATNPLLINGEPHTQSRLYSGDRLRMGSYSIVFISNLPEDVGQPDEMATAQPPKTSRAGWALVLFLVLSIGGYFGYLNVYQPWQIDQVLASVERQAEKGDLSKARDVLKGLLKKNLSSEHTQLARRLLAKTALRAADDKQNAGDVIGAKKYLSAHLSAHGSGPEAETLWDRMDYYRVTHGKQLEAQGKSQQALREFAAVRDASLYQVEAQKGIRRIWLKFQHQQRQAQSIAQLLQEGETHYAAKRFLTPVNRNAYAVYQAVLVLEPDHPMALKRIDQIKDFYRQSGEKHFKDKKWAAAQAYFERFRIIDPDDKAVAAKIKTCRQKQLRARTGKSTVASKKRNQKKNKANQQRQEVKQLLESSGTESAWIMKYLFEEQQGEAETETPWEK